MTDIPLTIRTDLIIEPHTITGIQTNQDIAPKPYNAFIVKSKSGDVLTVINKTYENTMLNIANYNYILLFNKTGLFYYLIAKDIRKSVPGSIVNTITDLIKTHSQDCYKMKPFIDESDIGYTQIRLSKQLAHHQVLYHDYAELITYTKAIDGITRLNTQLEKICPEFSISLDYVYRLPGELNLYSNGEFTRLTLCLYHKAGCVASIQLYILNGVVTFDSFTNPDYERNKYNSLLTCIMLMIGGDLEYAGAPVTELYAEVINKDLARLLLLTFKAQLSPSKNKFTSLFEFESVGALATPLTVDIINKYYTAKESHFLVKYAYVVFKLVPNYLKYVTDIYTKILQYYTDNHGCIKSVGPDPAITHPATFTKSKYSVTNPDPAITHPAILNPASKIAQNEMVLSQLHLAKGPVNTVKLELKVNGMTAKSKREQNATIKHLTKIDPAKIQFIELNVK